MSTDYAAHPPLRYDTTNLPDGITVLKAFASDDKGPSWDDKGPSRLFVIGIEHVLLVDRCGNTLWMRRLENGEARFEKFGLQGSIAHFGEAFRDAGHILYDTGTTLTYPVDGRVCRCGGVLFADDAEPIDP